MHRGLLIIGGLLVGLLAALFAVPAAVDWNRYRGVFEEEASRLIGREVRVGGRVNLRLLPTPYIRFEKIRVADTQANIGEPLFRADDLTIRLAVGPLFGGAFEASEIEINKPTVTLVLDDKGGGNWNTLGQAKSTSALLTSRISLEHARLIDGQVAIRQSDGRERVRFDHINGEFSAAALDGPYRVNVAFALGERLRELKLSTAKAEADGSLRFKALVRAPESGASYTLDATAAAILDAIKVDGDLSVVVPLTTAAKAAGAPAAEGKGAGAPSLEFKGKLKGTTERVDVSDLTASIETDGPPQLATGGASVDWRGEPILKLDLAARWLDLDRLAGEGNGGGAAHVLRKVVQAAEDWLPKTGRSSATLALEQATLGGDVAQGLILTLERQGDQLRLANLGVSLPGGSRLQASGAVSGLSADNLFDGDVVLRGATLSRFLGWAARGQSLPVLMRDGPFTLNGKVLLGSDRLAGRNLAMQLSGNMLSGDVSWSGGARRQLVAALDGSEIDLTPLLEAGEKPMAGLQRFFAKAALPNATAAPVPQWPEIILRLRLGKLIAANHVFNDALADIKYTGGNLVVSQLRLTASEGWSGEIAGDILGFAQPSAKGSVTGLVDASNLAALDKMLAFLDLPDPVRTASARAEALLPARLAVRMTIGDAGVGTRLIAVDGRVANGRAAGTIRLGPDAKTWRERRADVALTLDGLDAGRILGVILPAGTPPLRSGDRGEATPTPSRVVLRGIGTAGGGLASLLSLETIGTALEYRGRLGVDESAGIAIDGDLTVQSDNLQILASLARQGNRPALRDVTVLGAAKIAVKSGRGQVDLQRVTIGQTSVTGTMAIDAQSQETTRVTGRLSTGGVGIPALLALFNDRPALATDGQAKSQWSEAPLDLAPLQSLDLALDIDSRAITLAPGIHTGPGKLAIEGKAGHLRLKLTDAAVLGGKAAGELKFERTAAGLRFEGTAGLAGAKIEPSKDGMASTSGGLGFSMSLTGTGISPRGLISTLAGNGEVSLAAGRLAHVSAAAVRAAATAIYEARGEVAPDATARRLEQALAGATLTLGNRRLKATMADGVLRLQPIVLETADGKVTGSTVVDLDALRFDSEWRIESSPLVFAQAKKPLNLPPVSVVYAGELAGMREAVARISSEGLEREVQVHRMERDVAELERLRREDEERRRQEEERQKQDALQRQQSAPMPPPIIQQTLPVVAPANAGTESPGIPPGGPVATTAPDTTVDPAGLRDPNSATGTGAPPPASRPRAPARASKVIPSQDRTFGIGQ